MTTLETKLNPRSADFQANAQAMQVLVDDLRVQVAQVAVVVGGAGRWLRWMRKGSTFATAIWWALSIFHNLRARRGSI